MNFEGWVEFWAAELDVQKGHSRQWAQHGRGKVQVMSAEQQFAGSVGK